MISKPTVISGIVGAGFSANFHYEGIKRVYSVNPDVRGVFALDQDQAAAFAAKRGITHFSSLDALIDAVDLVHCCVLVSGHEEVAVAALKKGKSVIIEKPLTGYLGDGSSSFHGDTFPKSDALAYGLASVERILEAEKNNKGRIFYAENWVYAPSIQREKEIIEKTKAQILWIHGEEAHSGSHNATYAQWKFSGGGVMIGKGCHPLTAALYLKNVEGRARTGKPILPATVTARTAALTRMDNFQNDGFIRNDYFDIDDFSMMHVTFEDGTLATVFASDIILGGIHNWLEVAATNHRTVCNINPNTAMRVYNPRHENFSDIYTVEKIEQKQGWTDMPPDEDWFTGYPQEIEAFYRAAAFGEPVESDSLLGANTISTIYSAYLSAEQGGKEVAIRTF
ncbi:MAG TPA: Gfo/Idh/MocA family oxidoreductase [Candidatus Hydrogenedentes bacterium]|nr:Gfo/Idh/MocA family oxidoreductase [Candidatus Hydrogenedentota bacterium]HOD94701.1 Gfo/Idh/MocA family oxidoreductase [Candidatus Hydrogenedentota bacterium]HOM47282.1 Gfo/Idh/MocA family oxidoreductase [Candidatus Hydrogenedentota bacterium]HOR50174.1 Gfo/Idh/MocA family oxidoreductase [Candidatus Hydrogenedentota bacterium]HPK24483.1 Gfo/Idh/MocA family oxidoreductase [Candidatus Hydrogenedentota bacterium]